MTWMGKGKPVEVLTTPSKPDFDLTAGLTSSEVHSEPETMGETVSSAADAWHQDLSLLLAEAGRGS